MRLRPFTLWHRARDHKKWVKIDDFNDVVAALGEMEARRDRGETGDFKAILKGRDPEARDDDDDEEEAPEMPPRRPG